MFCRLSNIFVDLNKTAANKFRAAPFIPAVLTNLQVFWYIAGRSLPAIATHSVLLYLSVITRPQSCFQN